MFSFRVTLGTIIECVENIRPLHIETVLSNEVTSRERIFLTRVTWMIGKSSYYFRGNIADMAVKGHVNFKTNSGTYKICR